MYYYVPIVLGMFVAGFGMYMYIVAEPDIGESMYTTGVFDRIEDGGQAVILLEAWKKEYKVPIETLPPGSQVHMWFDVCVKEDNIKMLRINYRETKNARDKISKGQEKLRK
ncbi:DUF3006 domain-containing protein [Virgibacillus kimchii]